MVGVGDSGKTTVLDAIDYCLGARRSMQFSDYDFHKTDTTEPIKIMVALGDLDPTLQVGFGPTLRKYNREEFSFEKH